MAPPRRGQLGSMRTISLSNIYSFEEKNEDDKRGSLNRSKSSMNLRLGDIEEETASTMATTTDGDKTAARTPVAPTPVKKTPVDRRSALSRSKSVMELNQQERRRTPRRRVSATGAKSSSKGVYFSSIDETGPTSFGGGTQHHRRGDSKGIASLLEIKKVQSKKPMIRRSISSNPSDSSRWAHASELSTREAFRKFLREAEKKSALETMDDKSRRSRAILLTANKKQSSMRNLRYSQAEIVNLVDNDSDFRLMQRSLRQKGAITNAVLQQGLPFYLHNIRDRDDFDLDQTLRRPNHV